MILYPTETVYGLGVNPFDSVELDKLYELKGRDYNNPVSWLVRSVVDIQRYAQLSPRALVIAQKYLPGPLTLVVPSISGDELIGFRVSSDPKAQELINDYMSRFDAPLTCTSANLSGQPTLPTVERILEQFGDKSDLVDKVIDDGPRRGITSTVVKVVGDDVEIIRQGSVKI